MHEERQWQILRAAIGDYIADAMPVSSEGLWARYHFSVSPATIRNDLAALEEQGYLAHVHTSSGRVPTDRGYRLFVDELLTPALTRRDRAALDQALQARQAQFTMNLCEAIARCTRTYVEALVPGTSEVHAAGLTTLLNEPEFQDRDAIAALVSVVEKLRQEPEVVEEFCPEAQAEPLFMIGRELRPLMPMAEDLTLVAMRTASDREDAPIFLLLGPRRMVYPKIVALLNYIQQRNPGVPITLILTLVTLHHYYYVS